MKITINSPKYGKIQTLIDKEDYAKIKGKTLSINKVGKYLYIRVYLNKNKKQYLHRIVANTSKNKVTDHINKNTLDNRRKNLRVGTIQDNLRNQKRPNNKTGYTGVSIQKYWKDMIGYQASIKIDYKKIYLGFFKKLEDAVKARKEAEKKYWNKHGKN